VYNALIPNLLIMENDMKKLQVLGTRCPKCKELAAKAEEAAKALGEPAVEEKE